MPISEKDLDTLAKLRTDREAQKAPTPGAPPPRAAHVPTVAPGVGALLRAGQKAAPTAPPKPAAAPVKPAAAPKLIPATTSVGRVRTPALGEAFGTSGKRYLPAGATIGAFAARVGKTVAQLEDYAERSLAAVTGPAWIHTELPTWVAARRARFAWDGRRWQSVGPALP